MKPKALVIALTTLGAALPTCVQAAETVTLPTPPEIAQQWAGMFVYAVTPYCQVMSNGLRVCQPMGLVGPAPTAGKPPSQEALKLVPLAPPRVESSTAAATPYMPSPYAANPHMTSPYAAQPGGMPQYVMPQFTPPQFVSAQGAQAAAAPAPAAASVAAPAAPTAPAVTSQPASQPAAATSTAVALPPPAPMAITPLQPAASSLPAVAVAPAAATAATAATPAPAAAAEASDVVVVHFQFDSAVLDSSGRLVLDIWLAQAPTDKTVRITGHADRLGPESYNTVLSRHRAEAVKKYLTSKGFKAGDLQVIAMGEKAPIAKCKGGTTPATKACLAPNRRVEVDPQ